MFKIFPLNDGSEIKECLSACGAEEKSGAFTYVMRDIETNTLMGISHFELLSGSAVIYDIKEIPGQNDYEAMFILLRQTMNFIEKCGITSCIAELGSGEDMLLRSAGFKKTDDCYIADLTGMFDGHCSGHDIK